MGADYRDARQHSGMVRSAPPTERQSRSRSAPKIASAAPLWAASAELVRPSIRRRLASSALLGFALALDARVESGRSGLLLEVAATRKAGPRERGPSRVVPALSRRDEEHRHHSILL